MGGRFVSCCVRSKRAPLLLQRLIKDHQLLFLSFLSAPPKDEIASSRSRTFARPSCYSLSLVYPFLGGFSSFSIGRPNPSALVFRTTQETTRCRSADDPSGSAWLVGTGRWHARAAVPRAFPNAGSPSDARILRKQIRIAREKSLLHTHRPENRRARSLRSTLHGSSPRGQRKLASSTTSCTNLLARQLPLRTFVAPFHTYRPAWSYLQARLALTTDRFRKRSLSNRPPPRQRNPPRALSAPQITIDSRRTP